MQRSWQLTVDDRPMEVRVAVQERQLVVWIDGFPTHREPLPDALLSAHRTAIDVDGHRLGVLLLPGPMGGFALTLDGSCVDTGTAEAEIGGLRSRGAVYAGHLPLDVGRYYRCFPAWLRASLAAASLGLGLGLWIAVDVALAGGFGGIDLIRPTFAISLTLVGVGWIMQDIQRQQLRFATGEALPAVVVQQHPPAIACVVNLATQAAGAPKHTLLVKPQPLDRVGPVPPLGARLVVLAMLEPSQDGQRHPDASVVAASCGSSNHGAIHRLQRSVSRHEWDRLARACADANLPQPTPE